MDAISLFVGLCIGIAVSIIAITKVSRKDTSTTIDHDADIEKNDRKWEINKEKIEKLRAEIVQELKQNGRYKFDSRKEQRHEGLHLNDGELYELLSPFLRKGYFVLRSEFWFIYPNQYFEIKKHRGSYSSIWFVTEDELEHQL